MLVSAVLFELSIILILVLFNGFLAMSEMAIVSARKLKLEQLALKGSRGARYALDLANSPSQFLASIQVGITLIGVLTGAFGGATIAKELAKALADLPVLGAYADALALTTVVLSVTFLSLMFGELVPKRLALNQAETVSCVVSRPIRAISLTARPFVHGLGLLTDLILKVLGVRPQAEPQVTQEEVKILIEEGAKTGLFAKDEESIIKRVLKFSDRSVSELMTQRIKLVCIDANAPFEENLQKMVETEHSYFPVYEQSLDQIVGIVAIKRLLAELALGKKIALRSLLEEPLYVAESTPSLRLLEQFKSSGKHLALVVDEYGGNAGLITAIDVLEALVGDLPEEQQSGEGSFVQRADGSWLIDGFEPIHEVAEFFGLDEQKIDELGDFQTIGGFVMGALGRIPSAGESFTWGAYRFEVMDMDGRRVDKILVAAAPNPLPPDTDPSC